MDLPPRTKKVHLSYTAGLLVILILFTACRQHQDTLNIPDIETIYGNISYLDSLVKTRQIDSISAVNDRLAGNIASYSNNIQTFDDKIIIDSLVKINSSVYAFLEFCTDTHNNLELLEQDVKSVEMQYKSGKIEIRTYMNALLESEQVLVELNYQFLYQRERVLNSLHNQYVLISRLSPLSAVFLR